MALPLLTVGHGTLDEAAFTSLLQTAGVESLVDVRSYPASRRNPHTAREAMERWIPAAGIAYAWEPDLGGLRKPLPESRHVALRHDGFRAYADHMETAAFATTLDRLVAQTAERTVAVMCAESVWWRCHRRLLSDAAVLLLEAPVSHLFHDGRLAPHRPTPEARVEDGVLVYDVGVAQPML